MSPLRIRSTATVTCNRSVRCLGKSTPWEISPTWCPARPILWRPDATRGGDSTWITRSTAPMSMPSSREHVATTHRRRPVLRSSSIVARWSRVTEPWWARASRGSAPEVEPAWAMISAGARRRAGAEYRPKPLRLEIRPGWAQPLSPGTSRACVDLVEPPGEPLGQPPRVGEHDRRPVARIRSTIFSSTRGQIDACGCAPRPGQRRGAGRARPCPRREPRP